MITQVRFNWRQVASGLDDMGEDWDYAEVGKAINNTVNPAVVSIEEHPAAGEGDRWYYDINLSDGTKQRIFNPNRVYYAADSTRVPAEDQPGVQE